MVGFGTGFLRCFFAAFLGFNAFGSFEMAVICANASFGLRISANSDEGKLSLTTSDCSIVSEDVC